jgi:2-hydroxycyclohexanecarboxyl-CoA dehydrogenase
VYKQITGTLKEISMPLRGKVAVVTAGGSDTGRAVAARLAKDGAAISVWDLNHMGARKTVDQIIEAGGRAIACVGNVQSEKTVTQFSERTRQELGPITIFINNVAVNDLNHFLKIDNAQQDCLTDINPRAALLRSPIISDMVNAGWGRIINIFPSYAKTRSINRVHRVAYKIGSIDFTREWAAELAPYGITVNDIRPEPLDGSMFRFEPLDLKIAASQSPMRRPCRPEDIAVACSYLAAEPAGYITGHSLSVHVAVVYRQKIEIVKINLVQESEQLIPYKCISGNLLNI